MGLDMYLYKRTYIGNQYRKPESRVTVTVPKDEGNALYKGAAKLIDNAKINGVEETVAYWRKANHIHHWFVKNVQDGEDDCRDAYVQIEELQRLYNLCKKVIDTAEVIGMKPKDTSSWEEWDKLTIVNHSELGGLLPPSEGFFFGSTDIDGTYLYCTQLTIEQLAPYLEKDENDKYIYNAADFYYHSSW